MIQRYWRRFQIHCLNRCPDCKSKLAWGQWNDGAWAGRPICCNTDCPKPKTQ